VLKFTLVLLLIVLLLFAFERIAGPVR